MPRLNNSKTNESETWMMSSTEPVYTQQATGRLGSTSSNISFSNNDICRICHCEADNQNPLLAPCYCSGSLKYVHQACLQQWLTASATRSCELCKFNFIMHTKIKPFNEWRRLEMSGVERRRLCCAVLFHCVAALCVIWSLFVLIDRATEEVQKGLIAWPFWTKLVVVAVGFTGGTVFMYIQCRQYLHLCNRWRAYNRIILIQNAPEKIIIPPSPTFRVSVRPTLTSGSRHTSVRPAQVVANIENNPHSETHVPGTSSQTRPELPADAPFKSESSQTIHDALTNAVLLNESGIFGERNPLGEASTSSFQANSSTSINKTDEEKFNSVYVVQPYEKRSPEPDRFFRLESAALDPLEINIQEMLALDIEHTAQRSRTAKNSVISLADLPEKNKAVFKSLPNLSSNDRNLLF